MHVLTVYYRDNQCKLEQVETEICMFTLLLGLEGLLSQICDIQLSRLYFKLTSWTNWPVPCYNVNMHISFLLRLLTMHCAYESQCRNSH